MRDMQDTQGILEAYGPEGAATIVAAVLNWQSATERTVHLMLAVGEEEAARRLTRILGTLDEVVNQAVFEAKAVAVDEVQEANDNVRAFLRGV